MPYKIAGIDVHKRMLHVVVSDVLGYRVEPTASHSTIPA